MQKKKKGALLATAVAGLFIVGTGLSTTPAHGASSEDPGGYCTVKNSCKGKGACGVPGKHDCAGKNDCKGQGWVKLDIPKTDCEKVMDSTWKEKKAEEKKS